jgi:uncharacterized protein YqhQ
MKNIGGQAVIEGVMMKSPKAWTVAVRDTQGRIHVKRQRLKKLPKLWRAPLMRGVVALFHALVIGIKALEFSASKAYEDEAEEPLTKTQIALTIGASLLLGIGLFILLPLLATKLIGMVMPTVDKSSIAFNLVDGVIRVGVFILYIVLIGLWSEMRRIFEYHGAEHKVIHAFEHERTMEVPGIREFSPLHPRCGTSFLMIVMVVSIIVFSLIPQTWPLLAKFAARLVFIPLIAGLSYETLKISARFKDNPVVGLLVWPGLMLQRLTTRQPDDSQIEVALVALNEALAIEAAPDDAPIVAEEELSVA